MSTNVDCVPTAEQPDAITLNGDPENLRVYVRDRVDKKLRYDSDEDKEDVIQDTLLRVYEKQHQWIGKGSYQAWVSRTTDNKCHDFVRKKLKARKHGLTELLELLPNDRPKECRSPALNSNQLENRDELQESLWTLMARRNWYDQLGDTEQIIVEQLLTKQVQGQKVADTLGLARSTVSEKKTQLEEQWERILERGRPT